MLWPLYSRGNSPHHPLDRRLCGPGLGTVAKGKNLCPC